MAKTTKEIGKEKMDVASCAACHVGSNHWCGNQYCLAGMALRIIISLAVMVFVFSMGFKLGEFKGQFEKDMGYGSKMMRSANPITYISRPSCPLNQDKIESPQAPAATSSR